MSNGCLSCEEGTYSLGGRDVCTICKEGKISGVGASSCVGCEPGYVVEGNVCEPCPRGRYAAFGNLVCSDCGNGKYSAAGAAYCSTVGAGKQIVKMNGLRVGVSDCEADTFSTGANDTCTLCGDGGHSEAGSSSCLQTQPGQHFNVTLQRDVDCSPGRFSSNGGICVQCAEGFVAPKSRSSHCDVCQPGNYSNAMHTECIECPAGKFSGAASASCSRCEQGKYNEKKGQSFCVLCDDYIKRSTTDILGATSASNCFCLKGFYHNDRNDRDECVDVMEGVKKDVDKATLNHLPIEPGFWRTTNVSLEVKRCITPDACTGGNETGGYCLPGHSGPYCDVCSSGFAKDVMGICQSCEDNLSVGSILVTVIALFSFLFTIFLVKKKFYKKYKRKFKGLTAAIRILFVSYQITAVLPSIAPEMNLPENFTASMASLNFLKLDIFQMISFGCVSSSFDYYGQLLTMTILPIAICLLLWLAKAAVPHRKGLIGTIALIVAYSVMPSVSATVFGAFPCDTLDTDKSYLIADYSIDCSSGAYNMYSVYSGFMILIYPVGIPMVFGTLLVKMKDHINKPVADREKDDELFGMEFLFDNYKPEFWYFEVVVTVFRLLLTGVLGLIQPGSSTQLSVGMMIAGGAIVVTSNLRPYENERDNNLSILSYIQIFLVMMCALVLKTQDLAASDSFDKESLGYVLIGVNILVLLSAVALVVVQFWRSNEEDYQSDNVIAIAKRGKGAKPLYVYICCT